jgi:hypothetical protein
MGWHQRMGKLTMRPALSFRATPIVPYSAAAQSTWRFLYTPCHVVHVTSRSVTRMCKRLHLEVIEHIKVRLERLPGCHARDKASAQLVASRTCTRIQFRGPYAHGPRECRQLTRCHEHLPRLDVAIGGRLLRQREHLTQRVIVDCARTFVSD